MLYSQGKTDCTPSEAGYDESRIQVLNRHFQMMIDDGLIQCASYCVSRHGKVFMHGAIGKKSYRNDDPTTLTPDCINFVASITKVFTAVAIMKLVEDGKTRLNMPVGEILPQFKTPPFSVITLFHLLTHTSGLYADPDCFENKYQSNYWNQISILYDMHNPETGEFDWISAGLSTIGNGLMVKPDTEWAYCTFGFLILGAVIEKLSGMNACQYIEENILKPLRMTDSGFDITIDTAKRFILSNETHEKRINDILNGTAESHPLWDRIPNTGYGLISTPYDLIRFGNMMIFSGRLDGERILGRKAVEMMTRPAIHNKPDYCWGANTPDRCYGIGFDMRNDVGLTQSPGMFMHEGSGACSLYIDPKEEFTAAWFVPFAKEGWFVEAQFSVQNIIWSGII